MASQPIIEESLVSAQKRIRRRRGPVRLVDEKGRDIPKAVLVDITQRMDARREREEQVRALSRRPTREDASSIRFAMRSVEHRIVKGLWVIEISQDGDGPREQRRHGIGYMPDAADQWGEAVAKGGFQLPPPSPAVPSNREIDAAQEAIKWTDLLDEDQARLLRVAALTKRGDRLRRVNWDWVIGKLRLPPDTPLRTLRDRYDRALRHIVAELTLARVG